jgi:hypothetical protein
MEYLQILSVPAIATIVYWVVNLIKYATKENETFKRFIPLVSAGLGAVLGLACFYAIPNIIAAPNVLVAILSGGASGLSATGCNQVLKQLTKSTEENDDGKK